MNNCWVYPTESSTISEQLASRGRRTLEALPINLQFRSKARKDASFLPCYLGDSVLQFAAEFMFRPQLFCTNCSKTSPDSCASKKCKAVCITSTLFWFTKKVRLVLVAFLFLRNLSINLSSSLLFFLEFFPLLTSLLFDLFLKLSRFFLT